MQPAPGGRASCHGPLVGLLSCALLALGAGCGGGDAHVGPPPTATKLALLTPPPSQAQSGIGLSTQPVVQLQDDGGAAVSQAGVAVSVAIASGGGTLIGTTTVATAQDGRASFTGLGIRGTIGPHTLTFAASDLAAVTSGTIDLTSGPAAVVSAREGDQQTAPAGGAVAIPPSVIVSDADNNRVSGVPVTFQVASGGGTVDPTTPVNTDANGVAAVASWTLGTTAGPNTLSATAAGVSGSGVIFTATGAEGGTIRGTITVANNLVASAARVMTRAPTSSKSLARRSLLLLRADPSLSQSNRNLVARRALRKPEYVPGELLVTFKRPPLRAPPVGSLALASRSNAAAVSGEIRSRLATHLATHGAALTGISPAIVTARVRVPRSGDIAAVAAALRADPAVATVERNSIMRSEKVGYPAAGGNLARLPTVASNDPLFPYQAWNYGMIDLPEAWSVTTGSPNVLIAVVDDGIRFDHPALAANLTTDGYDFVSNPFQIPLCAGGGSVDFSGDGDGYDPDPTIPTDYVLDDTGECLAGPLELGNHGSYTAGIIGAVGNDGVGVSGINWVVRIRPVRVAGIYGEATIYDEAQGILYAAGLPADDGAGGTVQAPTGAKIINLSLAGSATSAVERDAVIAATNAGALIIAAAGNSATNTPEYPAAFPEALSVSAVGPDGELASYSSFGSTIDIAAPGGDIVDGDFLNGNFTFGVASAAWDFQNQQPVYVLRDGSSGAAPHVSGVAGLLLAQNPGLTGAQLRSRLTEFAVDAGSPGRDNRYGAGIVNARNSLAQNSGPSRQLRARLYDAATGAAVQTVSVGGDGSYGFGVLNGAYEVFAGQDESGDQLIGLPGRRWGAFGGAATPTRITVNGPGTHQASFTAGFPAEEEPNGSGGDFAGANDLPVGGYLIGATPPENDDNFRIRIAQAGQYTFETSGVDGACGFALEEDTILGLYRGDGTAADSNDDIDQPGLDFCSRITTTLQPGTYYLRVQGFVGGRYRIQARAGM
jgi:subtilisin family serine protease